MVKSYSNGGERENLLSRVVFQLELFTHQDLEDVYACSKK